MNTEYKSRRPQVLSDKEAQVWGTELQRLGRNIGGVTPQAVLNEAKRGESPLHSFFEWDDARAAQAHRMDQCRRFIQTVAVRVSDNELVLPAFCSVHVVTSDEPDTEEDGPRQYITINQVLTDDEKRARALRSVLRSIAGYADQLIAYGEQALAEMILDRLAATERAVDAKPTTTQPAKSKPKLRSRTTGQAIPAGIQA